MPTNPTRFDPENINPFYMPRPESDSEGNPLFDKTNRFFSDLDSILKMLEPTDENGIHVATQTAITGVEIASIFEVEFIGQTFLRLKARSEKELQKAKNSFQFKSCLYGCCISFIFALSMAHMAAWANSGGYR